MATLRRAGLVNLTSKTPEATAFQRLEVSAGNYDTQLANFDVNRPLDEEGHWLFRAVGGAQRNDGFTDMTESERKHISPMLTFAPSDHTSLTLIGAYQHDPKGGGYSGVSAFGSVLPSPFGELPEDINTGDPNYEVFDRYQRAVSALFRHDFNEHISLRTNARFQNTELSYRQIVRRGLRHDGHRREPQHRLLHDHSRWRRRRRRLRYDHGGYQPGHQVQHGPAGAQRAGRRGLSEHRRRELPAVQYWRDQQFRRPAFPT